jgi:acyl carrier protein
MTDAEIRLAVLEELTSVAPDIDAEDVGPDDDLMQDLEIDSMDFLNLVSALHKRLGVDVPEADYPSLATITLATKYLSWRLRRT